MTDYIPWKKPILSKGSEGIRKTVFDVGDTSIIGRKQKRDAFVKNADKQIEILNAKEKAIKDGFDEGHKKGYDEVTKKWQEKLQNLDNIINSLNSGFNSVPDIVSKQILEMSVLIAKNILRGELSSNVEFIERVIEESVNLLPKKSHEVKLLLNPEDLKKLEEVNYKQKLIDIESLKVIEDESIQQGGCKIETEVTEVDATLETRIKDVIDALYKNE